MADIKITSRSPGTKRIGFHAIESDFEDSAIPMEVEQSNPNQSSSDWNLRLQQQQQQQSRPKTIEEELFDDIDYHELSDEDET